MNDTRLNQLELDELKELLVHSVATLTENEALAVLENRFITPQDISRIAQTQRLTAFYSVRLRLVAHRGTPQAHAVKFVHYLHWFDLLRLSTEMTVSAPVRRAIETQLLVRVNELSLGEKITSARSCGGALIKVFLFDRHPRVFGSVLMNKRLREDDLVQLVNSREATADQLRMVAEDRKWSYRYAIRKALVLNPVTPRAAAASQLRYLSRRDLADIHSNPATSVYLRRCIERMRAAD